MPPRDHRLSRELDGSLVTTLFVTMQCAPISLISSCRLSRIALRPASPRDAARMLVGAAAALPNWRTATPAISPDLLQPGDALVVNNTTRHPAPG